MLCCLMLCFAPIVSSFVLQIAPSKAHSKSQVVLHLRANSMQEKASWLDSFTAHSLFMMQQDFQG